MGHARSKTRSLGQILDKPCVRSRGHIFCPIIMKLDRNVCLVKISDRIRIWVMSGEKLGQEVKSWKNLVYALEATFSV